MRTTIELSKEQRAELLKIAAQRGQKGFSQIIGEALDYYLEIIAFKKDKAQEALRLQGSFHGKEADLFEAQVANLREHWR
jgi:hypothetical protein